MNNSIVHNLFPVKAIPKKKLADIKTNAILCKNSFLSIFKEYTYNANGKINVPVEPPKKPPKAPEQAPNTFSYLRGIIILFLFIRLNEA